MARAWLTTDDRGRLNVRAKATWSKEWLERNKPPAIASSTYGSYASITKDLLRRAGDRPIGAFTQNDVLALRRELERDGLAPSCA